MKIINIFVFRTIFNFNLVIHPSFNYWGLLGLIIIKNLGEFWGVFGSKFFKIIEKFSPSYMSPSFRAFLLFSNFLK